MYCISRNTPTVENDDEATLQDTPSTAGETDGIDEGLGLSEGRISGIVNATSDEEEPRPLISNDTIAERVPSGDQGSTTNGTGSQLTPNSIENATVATDQMNARRISNESGSIQLLDAPSVTLENKTVTFVPNGEFNTSNLTEQVGQIGQVHISDNIGANAQSGELRIYDVSIVARNESKYLVIADTSGTNIAEFDIISVNLDPTAAASPCFTPATAIICGVGLFIAAFLLDDDQPNPTPPNPDDDGTTGGDDDDGTTG